MEPVCEAAHVQQVLHQAVEPVGLVVDGLQQDAGLVGSEGELVGEQAGGGRLDRGQRGAQVVADRGQQGRSQLVGPGQRVGLGRLGVEPVALERGGQLGGEGGEDLPVLGGEARTPQGQDLPVGQGEDHGGLVGVSRWLLTGGGHRCPDRRRSCRAEVAPPGTCPSQSGARPRPRGGTPPQFLEQGGQGIALRGDHPPGHPGQHPGIGPRLDGGGRPPGREVHQHAHHAGGDQEHDQGQDVAGVGDGEGVDGRREEVVGQEESGKWRPAAAGHTPPMAATITTSTR